MNDPMNRAEFDRRLKGGALDLTLVGISNAGKTYWSSRLEKERGFRHICCDDLIEAEVADVLRELGYVGGIHDMAKWMGQPYEERFAKNQQTYLDLEIASMKAINRELENGLQEGNTLIDTTGSVVHTGPEIRKRLKELTLVVYLEASPAMLEEMFKLYISEPKPVVWGDIFQPKPGEAPEAALARCYPRLLAHRSRLYEEMAHVTLPRPTVVKLKDAGDLLSHIRDLLPA